MFSVACVTVKQQKNLKEKNRTVKWKSILERMKQCSLITKAVTLLEEAMDFDHQAQLKLTDVVLLISESS